LCKRFGKTQAVDGLDLTVPRGAIFGFLGPNGAGKSTTIRMLTGLLRPSGGQAFVLGKPLAQRLRIGHRVGALVEEPAFYGHLTAWQNLRLLASLSGGARADEMREALERVGLADRARHRVSTFSHGMKQRLGIAQALVPRPELLILDEPASGLDPEGLAEVRDLMRSLADDGVTIFLSSHLLAEVEQLCTEVAMISHGRIVTQGALDELVGGDGWLTRIGVDDIERASAVLAALPVAHVEVLADRTLQVLVPGMGSADLNEVLVKAGLRVNELMPARRTLESTYMEIMRQNKDTKPTE
jgi:ABC-2 type transport system ATP-binding protein